MNEQQLLRQSVAEQCVRRMEAQGLKGEARDRAALEFCVGAAAAHRGAIAWPALSMLAFLCSVLGFSEVEKFAQDGTRQTG